MKAKRNQTERRWAMSNQAFAELSEQWEGDGKPPQNPARGDRRCASGTKQPINL